LNLVIDFKPFIIRLYYAEFSGSSCSLLTSGTRKRCQ